MAAVSPYLSALSMRDLVLAGEVSCRDLVEASLERISATNPQTMAVVAQRAEAALAEAEMADRMAAGAGRGVLHGLPVVIKDLTETTDLPTTYGSRALADHYPPTEAVVVTRLRKAGAIVVGKTNTPETGLRPTTENLLFGPTRNPWSLEHSPGGSSGGAAAALALGMVPLAQGTDAAGSGRIPASCCGVVGLKPSRGLVTLAPAHYDLMAGMGTNSPMARTVEDAALLLDAMAGPAVGDPYAVNGAKDAGSFLEAASRPPGPCRIGVCMTPGHGTLSQEVEDIVRVGVEAFAGSDHQLDEIKLDLGGLFDSVFTICAAQAAAIVDTAIPPDRLGLLEGSTIGLARCGWRRSSGDYVAAVTGMRREAARLLEAMGGYDYIITPTLTQPPPRLDHFPTDGDLENRWVQYLDWMAFVYPFNCTGQPAISVPAGRTRAGLPVGLQIVGRPGYDADVVALAAVFSHRRSWSDEHPPEPQAAQTGAA